MKSYPIFIICFIFTSYIINSSASEFPNLEERTQSFILEDKKISIPGFPDAFNPSIIRWYDGRLLLSFRTRELKLRRPNLIGFAWLDENFKVVGKPTLLNIKESPWKKFSRAQNPRLIRCGDTYYIVYNNILNDDDLESRRMIVAPLNYENGQFYIEDMEYLLHYEGQEDSWIEKNWAPLNSNGSLLLSYTLNPHKVLKPLMKDNACETIAVTKQNISWEWGEIHGGTPSLLVNDHYLGFFHSWIDMKSQHSNGEKISHYFIGAYCLNETSPFELTKISPEPIIGSKFYTSRNYLTWKPLKVVFPGGFVFNDRFIWLVYGKQDYECWVMKMDKEALLNSLVDVKSP